MTSLALGILGAKTVGLLISLPNLHDFISQILAVLRLDNLQISQTASSLRTAFVGKLF